MKISVLLPYKENFSPLYPGAISIFLHGIILKSKFRNKITVYGNTKYKKKLNSNYINLNITKSFLKSSTKSYLDAFIKKEFKTPNKVEKVFLFIIFFKIVWNPEP